MPGFVDCNSVVVGDDLPQLFEKLFAGELIGLFLEKVFVSQLKEP